MNNEPYIPERFFERFDESLPDIERLQMLEECVKWLSETEARLNRKIPLPVEDVEVLWEYAHDESLLLRKFAVDYLCSYGPVTWKDLEIWAVDPEEDVRQQALWAIGSALWPAGMLCRTDTERCVQLLKSVSRQYADYAAGNVMADLVTEDRKWLEPTWQAVEELIELQSIDINTMIQCCYLEHVIPDNNWGPDDPHIRAWLEGRDTTRKCLLLEVAHYEGLAEGRFQGLPAGPIREIVAVLSRDHNKEIALASRELLEVSINRDKLHRKK